MGKLLEGKVARVTGGGRGVALALAQAGANVVVNDLGASLDGRSGGEQPAQEVAAQIEALGGRAVIDGGSVADWTAAHRMVETAVETFGRIDIVVNNAGILRDVMFHRMGEAEFDDVIAVHLKGSFNVSRAEAPHFKAQGSGCYVHMTSTSGLKKLVPERVSPFVVALCADAASHVSGQVFGVRNNEIFLFSQPRPIRSAHRSNGWTPESVLDTALPMLAADFYRLDRSADVFTWDPV